MQDWKKQTRKQNIEEGQSSMKRTYDNTKLKSKACKNNEQNYRFGKKVYGNYAKEKKIRIYS